MWGKGGEGGVGEGRRGGEMVGEGRRRGCGGREEKWWGKGGEGEPLTVIFFLISSTASLCKSDTMHPPKPPPLR